MRDLELLILQLYNQLESLAEEYDELTDTDVREDLHKTINYYFVWGKPVDQLPCNYSMFTEAGNNAVASIIRTFLNSAGPLADSQNISLGQSRLNALQDERIRTDGGNGFDLFIGRVDKPLPPSPLPESRFDPTYLTDEEDV